MLGLMFFVVGPLVGKYSEMPGSASLQHGQRVLFQMMGRDTLRSIGFFDEYPEARPSDFVELIKDPNHILWPPEPHKDKRHVPDTSASSNRHLKPASVVFSFHNRTTTDSDEIVLVPDDENRQIILRGYSPGETETTYEYIWDFPTKAGKVKLNR